MLSPWPRTGTATRRARPSITLTIRSVTFDFDLKLRFSKFNTVMEATQLALKRFNTIFARKVQIV
jgi:hypothetical protein